MDFPKTDWFNKYWAHKLTQEFSDWFIPFMGTPEEYGSEEDYWTTCAFALAGWLAAKSLEKEDEQ